MKSRSFSEPYSVVSLPATYTLKDVATAVELDIIADLPLLIKSTRSLSLSARKGISFFFNSSGFSSSMIPALTQKTSSLPWLGWLRIFNFSPFFLFLLACFLSMYHLQS
jgi:hypothetical protein